MSVSTGESGAADAQTALLASWVLTGVCLFQGVVSMLTQVNDSLSIGLRAATIAASLTAAILFLATQSRSVQGRPIPSSWCWLALVAATVAVAVGSWLSLAPGLATIAFTMRRKWFGTATVGWIAALSAALLAQDVSPLVVAGYLVIGTALGLVLYCLTRLAIIVGELARTREVLARMKVDEERHRLSRDLHDILGRTLVAVSLRIQTAVRLLDRDIDTCREQLDEVSAMVSEGQSSLRALARGRAIIGLPEEITAANDLLAQLGIRCTTDTVDVPDDEDGRLFARILRESVTNLLKHSRPTRVDVTLREESAMNVLTIVNDGAPSTLPSTGTGLADLGARVGRRGGTLGAGLVPGSRFRVIARLPKASLPVEQTREVAPATVLLDADRHQATR